MVFDLTYPPVRTYFIAHGNGRVAYGITETDQQTTTGLENFETFTDEVLYQARLLEFDIVLEDE